MRGGGNNFRGRGGVRGAGRGGAGFFAGQRGGAHMNGGRGGMMGGAYHFNKPHR